MKDLLNSFQNCFMNIFGENHNGAQSQSPFRNPPLPSLRFGQHLPQHQDIPGTSAVTLFPTNCSFHFSLESSTNEPPINKIIHCITALINKQG